MGDHVNKKKDPSKHHKRGFAEGQDVAGARMRRVSFKNYLKELEEDLLDLELQEDDETTEE